jgi:hypothetical protein
MSQLNSASQQLSSLSEYQKTALMSVLRPREQFSPNFRFNKKFLLSSSRCHRFRQNWGRFEVKTSLPLIQKFDFFPKAFLGKIK